MLRTIRFSNRKISPEIRKIISNIGWLSAGSLTQKGITFLVSAFLARYLGTELFGMYNYAFAFVVLLGSVAPLGLQGIVVRDLVREPEQSFEILGTTFFLKMLGGIFCVLAIATVVRLNSSYTPLMGYLIAIFSIRLLFGAFTAIDLWFQSYVVSRYTVYSQTIALLCGAVVQYLLILQQAPIQYFAMVNVAEVIIVRLGFVIFYIQNNGKLRKWRINIDRGRKLLSQSWPLILSSVGAIFYLKIDQIMIGQLVGLDELGVYSAAVRLSEVWYFIPTFVAASIFPAIIRASSVGESIYNQRMQYLYDFMALVGILIATTSSLVAKPLILLLYGIEYQAASVVFAIHIWACVFVFMGEVLSKWLINEGLLKFSLVRHGIGAFLNVVCNLVLIPRYGIVGAAVATVASYSAASYFSCFVYTKTWPAARQMTLALMLPMRAMRYSCSFLRRP